MPNVFLTPKAISSASIAALTHQSVLAGTIWRDAESTFAGRVGDTVTVRTETVLGEARRFVRAENKPLVMDELTETSIDITLDAYLYKGVNLPDEQLTLNIGDFARQVAQPQAKSVADSIEVMVAAQINALTSGLPIKPDGSDLHAAIVAAAVILDKAGVPDDERYLAISPDVKGLLLVDPRNKLVPADVSGSPAALRRAIIGDLYGFTVLKSTRLAAGSALAYHRTAFSLATRALDVPAGATFGQSVTHGGFALRLIRDYDPMFQQDRSVVSTLAGAGTIRDGGAVKRAVRLTAAAA
ncbi:MULTISPECIES: P22 phage major capsid protein family protein [unclassified Crossiella]|uniref:P22 phage major capsid protein family protein n=1 Tax=unclassified Crossiella TaxID=2620835 RepID=UPI001FFE640C|nr:MULTISPECIES: P22 phage major capsid protein family protein [unclassified Crossiella]MCK2237713.1 hypothetical protein [Crossiella sp. S99.2]MCK2254999.1 hypothetical protein [Crossiella sp. S99.1]